MEKNTKTIVKQCLRNVNEKECSAKSVVKKIKGALLKNGFDKKYAYEYARLVAALFAAPIVRNRLSRAAEMAAVEALIELRTEAVEAARNNRLSRAAEMAAVDALIELKEEFIEAARGNTPEMRAVKALIELKDEFVEAAKAARAAKAEKAAKAAKAEKVTTMSIAFDNAWCNQLKDADAKAEAEDKAKAKAEAEAKEAEAEAEAKETEAESRIEAIVEKAAKALNNCFKKLRKEARKAEKTAHENAVNARAAVIADIVEHHDGETVRLNIEAVLARASKGKVAAEAVYGLWQALIAFDEGTATAGELAKAYQAYKADKFDDNCLVNPPAYGWLVEHLDKFVDAPADGKGKDKTVEVPVEAKHKNGCSCMFNPNVKFIKVHYAADGTGVGGSDVVLPNEEDAVSPNLVLNKKDLSKYGKYLFKKWAKENPDIAKDKETVKLAVADIAERAFKLESRAYQREYSRLLAEAGEICDFENTPSVVFDKIDELCEVNALFSVQNNTAVDIDWDGELYKEFSLANTENAKKLFGEAKFEAIQELLHERSIEDDFEKEFNKALLMMLHGDQKGLRRINGWLSYAKLESKKDQETVKEILGKESINFNELLDNIKRHRVSIAEMLLTVGKEVTQEETKELQRKAYSKDGEWLTKLLETFKKGVKDLRSKDNKEFLRKLDRLGSIALKNLNIIIKDREGYTNLERQTAFTAFDRICNAIYTLKRLKGFRVIETTSDRQDIWNEMKAVIVRKFVLEEKTAYKTITCSTACSKEHLHGASENLQLCREVGMLNFSNEKSDYNLLEQQAPEGASMTDERIYLSVPTRLLKLILDAEKKAMLHVITFEDGKDNFRRYGLYLEDKHEDGTVDLRNLSSFGREKFWQGNAERDYAGLPITIPCSAQNVAYPVASIGSQVPTSSHKGLTIMADERFFPWVNTPSVERAGDLVMQIAYDGEKWDDCLLRLFKTLNVSGRGVYEILVELYGSEEAPKRAAHAYLKYSCQQAEIADLLNKPVVKEVGLIMLEYAKKAARISLKETSANTQWFLENRCIYMGKRRYIAPKDVSKPISYYNYVVIEYKDGSFDISHETTIRNYKKLYKSKIDKYTAHAKQCRPGGATKGMGIERTKEAMEILILEAIRVEKENENMLITLINNEIFEEENKVVPNAKKIDALKVELKKHEEILANHFRLVFALEKDADKIDAFALSVKYGVKVLVIEDNKELRRELEAGNAYKYDFVVLGNTVELQRVELFSDLNAVKAIDYAFGPINMTIMEQTHADAKERHMNSQFMMDIANLPRAIEFFARKARKEIRETIEKLMAGGQKAFKGDFSITYGDSVMGNMLGRGNMHPDNFRSALGQLCSTISTIIDKFHFKIDADYLKGIHDIGLDFGKRLLDDGEAYMGGRRAGLKGCINRNPHLFSGEGYMVRRYLSKSMMLRRIRQRFAGNDMAIKALTEQILNLDDGILICPSGDAKFVTLTGGSDFDGDAFLSIYDQEVIEFFAQNKKVPVEYSGNASNKRKEFSKDAHIVVYAEYLESGNLDIGVISNIALFVEMARIELEYELDKERVLVESTGKAWGEDTFYAQLLEVFELQGLEFKGINDKYESIFNPYANKAEVGENLTDEEVKLRDSFSIYTCGVLTVDENTVEKFEKRFFAMKPTIENMIEAFRDLGPIFVGIAGQTIDAGKDMAQVKVALRKVLEKCRAGATNHFCLDLYDPNLDGMIEDKVAKLNAKANDKTIENPLSKRSTEVEKNNVHVGPCSLDKLDIVSTIDYAETGVILNEYGQFKKYVLEDVLFELKKSLFRFAKNEVRRLLSWYIAEVYLPMDGEKKRELRDEEGKKINQFVRYLSDVISVLNSEIQRSASNYFDIKEYLGFYVRTVAYACGIYDDETILAALDYVSGYQDDNKHWHFSSLRRLGCIEQLIQCAKVAKKDFGETITVREKLRVRKTSYVMNDEEVIFVDGHSEDGRFVVDSEDFNGKAVVVNGDSVEMPMVDYLETLRAKKYGLGKFVFKVRAWNTGVLRDCANNNQDPSELAVLGDTNNDRIRIRESLKYGHDFVIGVVRTEASSKARKHIAYFDHKTGKPVYRHCDLLRIRYVDKDGKKQTIFADNVNLLDERDFARGVLNGVFDDIFNVLDGREFKVKGIVFGQSSENNGLNNNLFVYGDLGKVVVENLSDDDKAEIEAKAEATDNALANPVKNGLAEITRHCKNIRIANIDNAVLKAPVMPENAVAIVGHSAKEFGFGKTKFFNAYDSNCEQAVAIKKAIKEQVLAYIQDGKNEFYCFAEPGVGLWAAQAISELKADGHNVKLNVVFANLSSTNYFSSEVVMEINEVLDSADEAIVWQNKAYKEGEKSNRDWTAFSTMQFMIQSCLSLILVTDRKIQKSQYCTNAKPNSQYSFEKIGSITMQLEMEYANLKKGSSFRSCVRLTSEYGISSVEDWKTTTIIKDLIGKEIKSGSLRDAWKEVIVK